MSDRMEIITVQLYRFGAMIICGFGIGTLLAAIFIVIANIIAILLG